MIVVYYCDVDVPFDEALPILKAQAEYFHEGPAQITDMLARMRELHKQGKFFITSASHTRDGIVQGVIDGKLPDGTDYTWKKRRL